jgi:hypothetical protein
LQSAPLGRSGTDALFVALSASASAIGFCYANIVTNKSTATMVVWDSSSQTFYRFADFHSLGVIASTGHSFP